MSQSESSLRSLTGRRVLVTGGSGFIGRHLSRRLIAAGAEVHATSRSARAPSTAGPTWLQADPADGSQVKAVFAAARPHIVYHLAGAVGAGPQAELVLPAFDSLLASTIQVLLCALEHGCERVVLAGSFTEPPAGEAWPVPGSPYAAAKWAASAYGRMFHALYGLPVVVLRPFMAYGPGQASGKLIPTAVTALLRGEAPRLSSGLAKADWVFIDDVIEAFALAAVTPDLGGKTIDIGSGQLVSIRTVIERLAALVGNGVEPLFGALPDRPRELEVFADTAPAAQLLGWRAETSLDEGLRRMIDWAAST